MSLFSRRSMMIVAGCAMVVPLAAGTASAAFDADGGNAAPVENASATVEGSVSSTDAAGSIESPLGDGAVETEENGARLTACAAGDRPCVAIRESRVPTVAKEQLVELETIDADALAEASKDGASVMGSTTVQREDLSGSIDASTDEVAVEADTPLGGGSADVTVDGSIAADVLHGGR
jgi:hypothetical protein